MSTLENFPRLIVLIVNGANWRMTNGSVDLQYSRFNWKYSCFNWKYSIDIEGANILDKNIKSPLQLYVDDDEEDGLFVQN